MDTLERQAAQVREALTALLGSPQAEFPAIHLTGTNGKTSTARILTALLVAEGLSVGTYSSPHLQSVCERISLDGTSITEDRLAELITRIATIEPFLDDRGLYAAYGPDVNGQFQKLRAGDGVHFTKAGARKLAYFLEAEIRRAMEGARPKADLEVAVLAPQQTPVAEPPTSAPLPPPRSITPSSVNDHFV